MSHYIKKLEISKVRHLTGLTISLDGKGKNHLILTGRNGSGKTSLLEAIRDYLVAFAEDYDERKMILDDLHHVQNSSKDLLQKTGVMFISNEERIDDKNLGEKTGVIIDIMSSNEYAKSLKSGNFILAYYPAERKYSVANGKHIEKIILKNQYSLVEHPGQEFVKYLLDCKTKESFYRGSGAIEKADGIKAWFDRLTGILREIFEDPQLELAFDIETFEFKIVETGHEPFSFAELSSGYAAILDIVTDLMIRMEKNHSGTYDCPGIVLIDEIDVHLHLFLQKNIMPILTGLFPNIQFIVSTHSPFVLGSAKDTVIYDLQNKICIPAEQGLSNIPYSGIVEGFFNVKEMSRELEEKYQRFQDLAKQETFSDNDMEELGMLMTYLDEIPHYLALSISAGYQKTRLELEQRLGAEG